MAKNNTLRFIVGNYIDRVNDACYIELGDSTIYFSNKKIIAMHNRETLYRVTELDSGILYKRVRHAMMRHKPKKIQQMGRDDLNVMVEAAIMNMASKLVDDKLGVMTA